VLGRPAEPHPNCNRWAVSGTVYNNSSGSQRLNGILVRVWAFGQVQGTDTTGTHANRPGYWEWGFAKGSDIQGQVAIVNPDGSLRSPRYDFHLTSNCNAESGVNVIILDFVGTH
jgi:hypothetical protein